MITETGDKTGQFRVGLHERFGNLCPANNWASFPNLPANDPRIVYVYQTSPAIFSGTGNEAAPNQSSLDNGDIWGHFIP